MTIPETLKLAREHHQAGRLAEAEKLYRQVLEEAPRHADALHRLGNVLRQAGRLDAAAAAYRRALELNPDSVELAGNLGNTLQQQGQLDAAIAAFRRVLELRPSLAEAHYNLGNALTERGELDQAIAAYRRALQLKPQLAMAHSNLGNALRDQGQTDAAIASYHRALQLNPNLAEAHNSLGNALRRSGQLDAAMTSYRKAIGIRPEFAEAHANLGHALKEKGRPDEAIAALRTASRLRPDVPAYGYVLAALTGQNSAASAPAGYVGQLFDEYAQQFDDHLVGKLGYRGPQQLYAAVTAMAPGRQFDILDLGCGTGLCGVQFRALARSLVGIDLAPKMIHKAAARGIYDRLITGDVVTAMQQEQAGSFDLILAGDVFVYVGELAGAFGAASRLLREEGLLAFSVERHAGNGFLLQASARFAHSLSYLRELSREHFLSEDLVQEVTLRQEYGTDIAAWIVVLRKSAAAFDR